MHRTRTSNVLMVLGACCLGLAAWALTMATGPAAGQVNAKAPKVTVVNVTAGQPSELAFKLSKLSSLPVGKVTFKVTNKGKIVHDFKVCARPAATTKANTCTGTGTKKIQPGKSAIVTVTFKAKGKYEFLCTVPGHAGAGMKGLVGVGVKVTATASTDTDTSALPTPTYTAPDAAGSTTKTCASPQNTTVSVSAFDFGYTLSPSSVPCGTVTFNMRNTGNAEHDFVVEGLVGQGRTAVVDSGGTTSTTATLTPGTWTYYCSVPTHRGLGMEGRLTVTG